MSTRQIAYVAVLAALYIIIGQFTRFIPNPMVRGGSTIALNMVVIVIAGILLGPLQGALVGLIGTGLNAFITSGQASGAYELAAIIPHTIMGLTAGLVGRQSLVLGALTIIVGHVLNVIAFILGGLLPATQLVATIFAVGLLAEVIIDVIVILIVVPLLRPALRTS
ncbi:MAG TPA: ECF transporter S component [bacterium]|jgi:uncharacterized membrane protein|nr:ECF transporter S component [bacterium]